MRITQKIRPDDRFNTAGYVVPQKLEDELVLLDLSGGAYFGLNEVGTRMWALLEQGCDTGHIVDVISEEYKADRENVREDIENFLTELLEKGLIESDRPRPYT